MFTKQVLHGGFSNQVVFGFAEIILTYVIALSLGKTTRIHEWGSKASFFASNFHETALEVAQVAAHLFVRKR